MVKEKQKQNLMGVQRHEWDSNEWKWDRNLFIAERLNTSQSPSNCIELLPNDGVLEDRKGSEKRRKLSVLEENELQREDASLALNLGGSVYPIVERDGGNGELNNEKKLKAQPGSSKLCHCQVDDCYANLNDAKAYHRRHKVCEMHAKSGTVLLGGVLQRFCQQCSRFHMLQEFDEEKRSCRRRLAGHNRRRRKNNLDMVAADQPLKDDCPTRYLLFYLLRILSNLHSNNSDQSKDQNILLQLLRMLSTSASTSEPLNLTELVQLPQLLRNTETLTRVSEEETPDLLPSSFRGSTVQEPSAAVCSTMGTPLSYTNHGPAKTICQSTPRSVEGSGKAHMPLPRHNYFNETMGSVHSQDSSIEDDPEKQADAVCSLKPPVGQVVRERTEAKLNDFDLNIMYTEIQNHKEGSDRLAQNNGRIQAGPSVIPSCIQWDSHQTSPAHTSSNSESISEKSSSSSGEDVQCQTDRIIFKLFGKGPSDLPPMLRAQILNWLSDSPTDIESYIRPGCIVLTIYLRLSRHMWEELCCNLTSSLKKLLEASDNNFWTTGWICANVGHKLAFIHNGQVLLDAPLLRSQDTPSIVSIMPVAVAVSAEAIFTVKGTNLTCTTTKLLCAFQGNQVVHQNTSDPREEETDFGTDTSEIFSEPIDDIQTLSFRCLPLNTSGRGFVEVEDHELSCGFLPFIVAEQDVCLELRTLESSLEITGADEMSSRDQNMEFIQEFGWLLERSHLVSRSDVAILQRSEFSTARFKWLLEFSVEHDWCAVVRKILNILFDRKVGGIYYSVERLLDEVSPLHRAVRRNCGLMVEFLLKFSPEKIAAKEDNSEANFRKKAFKSSMKGPGGITPLHIAASMEGAEGVLNLLTNDEEQDWLHTWEKSRDESGFTPEDYASQRGHVHYIQLVQRKKSHQTTPEHMILDVLNSAEKHTGLNIDGRNKPPGRCRVCDYLSVKTTGHRALRYRPAILSMVAIAAVCVCVGIILKSPPEVLFVVAFRWELLEYGFI